LGIEIATRGAIYHHKLPPLSTLNQSRSVIQSLDGASRDRDGAIRARRGFPIFAASIWVEEKPIRPIGFRHGRIYHHRHLAAGGESGSSISSAIIICNCLANRQERIVFHFLPADAGRKELMK